MTRRGGWRRLGSRRFRYEDSRGRRDHGRGRAGADRVAGHSARLEGRLDLAARRRKAAGNRRRQGGAPAIPLPPGIPGAPGAGEIRQPRAVRGAATGAAQGDGQAPRPGAAELRMDGCGRRAADQRRLVPGRRRALRQDVQDVRDHDAAQGARQGARQQDLVSLPREAPRPLPDGARRRRARERDQGAARRCPAGGGSFATSTTASSSTSARGG